MSEVFAARRSMRQQVEEGLVNIQFAPAGARYSIHKAHRLHLAVNRVLRTTFNPFDSGDGMAALTRSSPDANNPSALSGINSTDMETTDTIKATDLTRL